MINAQITTSSLRHWLGGIITVIHDVSTGRRPPCAVDQENEHPEHFSQCLALFYFILILKNIIIFTQMLTL